MTTSIDGKAIVSTIYHAAVETVLTIAFPQIGRKIFKSNTPKVDFSPMDVGMAMATKDALIKQGIIPADIMK